MLVDNINLEITAGTGGNGAVSFLSNGQNARGGPDGGKGGNGGSIYFIGSTNINDLREFRFHKMIEAPDGEKGARQNMYGRNGGDVTTLLPLGTRVTDLATNTVVEITDTTTPILMARGGRGGQGNIAFKSSTNQAPKTAEKGLPGENKQLHLELRLIAEIGLIGLPNAGKSSMLTVLTHATPKIGNYPFTTLEPTIGMFDTHPIADIPGLIQGASHGKGLGLDFLKHIEKTKILLHCVDVTGEDPIKSYETIREELGKFDPLLLTKPEYIVLTKVDLADAPLIKKVTAAFKRKDKNVFTSSAYDPEKVIALKEKLEIILNSPDTA